MDRRIGFEIRTLQQIIKHKIHKNRLKENMNLTHGQIRVLNYISRSDTPIYQKDIEEYLHVRRSTATEILKILERDGYIVRKKTDFDGRLKEITITPLTKGVVSKMEKNIENLEKELRENISKDDLEIFFKVLDQVKENIK